MRDHFGGIPGFDTPLVGVFWNVHVSRMVCCVAEESVRKGAVYTTEDHRPMSAVISKQSPA